MEIRKLLARRLRDLMDSRPDLDTQTKVAQRSGVGQSTIQRLLACEQAATVDMLAKISKAFGMKPDEMLIEDLRDAQLMRTFSRLSDPDKARLQAFMDLSLSINGQMLHDRGSPLNLETRVPVPTHMTAARTRAGGREPSSDIVNEARNGKSGKPSVKRRKA